MKLTPVTEAVDEIEQAWEIDLTRSGLVPVGDVGDLHVTDSIQIRRDGFGEIVSHDPHVKEVVLQFEIGGTDFIREREGLGRFVQIKPGNRPLIDGLDEQRHAVTRELARGVAEVRYISVAQLRSINVRWCNTRKTVHLLAAKCPGVVDPPGNAFAELG